MNNLQLPPQDAYSSALCRLLSFFFLLVDVAFARLVSDGLLESTL